jgi:hypothetical protein
MGTMAAKASTPVDAQGPKVGPEPPEEPEMTLTQPGPAGTVRSSHGAHPGVERGYPASLSVMVAEQRTADLIRTAELVRTARQAREGSPREATAVVKLQGALGAVRLAVARALTRNGPRSAVRLDATGSAALSGSPSQLVCCA